jgi:hypothetical protein
LAEEACREAGQFSNGFQAIQTGKSGVSNRTCEHEGGGAWSGAVLSGQDESDGVALLGPATASSPSTRPAATASPKKLANGRTSSLIEF